MEKKYNHKWNVGNWTHQTCEKCGCEKDKTGMTVKYKLNGVETHNAPSCIKPVRKKYPSKYGKKPNNPHKYKL